MKKQKVFQYAYPFSRERLLDQLNDRRGVYHNWSFGEYLVEIKSDDRFFLGVERGGHSGGYWYVATVEEKEDKMLSISGKIVYNPDEDGNEQNAVLSRKEKVAIAFGCILLFPLIVLTEVIINPIYILILAVRKKPYNKEGKLDRFMVEYLNCKKL